jgi:hypothetical protein
LKTSLLALGPPTVALTGKNRSFENDFVNTQAIIARSLAMNAAFPQVRLCECCFSPFTFFLIHCCVLRSSLILVRSLSLSQSLS